MVLDFLNQALVTSHSCGDLILGEPFFFPDHAQARADVLDAG